MHRRWKVACSLKPPFPAPQISYLSENVGQADVVLRDPATIHLQHAAVPPGVQYIVKYYAGAFNPDSHPDHFRSETKVPTFAEGCSYEFTYNKQKYHFPVLIISMTVEFDADQAFTTMTTREEWAIKMTHSPPDATDVFLKTATIDSTTHKFQAITISCRNDECGGAGAPKCRVTYRRFRTIDSAPGDAEICDEAGPCDVNVQDPQYNVLLMRVQARCENVEDEWIPSSWVWFEMPIQTTAPPNPILAPSTTPSQEPNAATPRPSPTEPPLPRIPNITSWHCTCCEQILDACVLDACDPCSVTLRGHDLDRVSRVRIGARFLTCTTKQTTKYECSIRPGLGADDMTVERLEDADWVARNAIVYPQPSVSAVVAGLASTAGGSAVTLRGTNLGGAVFRGFSSSQSAPWTVHYEQVQFHVSASIGGTRAAGVTWVSDSEMVLRTPHGVGVDRRVLLSIHGNLIEPAGTISYVPPELTSLQPSIGPGEGGIRVTLFGQSFGHRLSSDVNTLILTSDCSATMWISDSSMMCVSPQGIQGSAVPATVVVAGQIGAKQGAYHYTSATDKVVLVLAHSPAELRSSSSGRSRLESFCIWLKAILGLKESSQIYIDGVQEYAPSPAEATLVRNGPQKTKLVIRFFASPKDPNRAMSAVLKDLEFLATSSSGFSGSGLEVETVELQPGGKVIEMKDASSPGSNSADLDAVDAESRDTLSPLVVGIIAGSLVVAGAAGVVLYWRRHLNALSEAGGVEITTRPNDIHLRPERSSSIDSASGSATTAGRSRLSVRADSVFAPSPKASRGGSSRQLTNGMCDQCRNSGFTTCVHRTMGLVEEEPPEEDEEDEDTLCVICLSGPREALVVHADEAKSSHRVLCLACAYKILEQGGSCPMCRKTIFAVFKAKTKEDTGPTTPYQSVSV